MGDLDNLNPEELGGTIGGTRSLGGESNLLP